MDINFRPKMGCVRATIGLTGQLDRPQPGNYFKPWGISNTFGVFTVIFLPFSVQSWPDFHHKLVTQ